MRKRFPSLKILQALILLVGGIGLFSLLLSPWLKGSPSFPAKAVSSVSSYLLHWGGWGVYPFFAFLLVLGGSFFLRLGPWIIPIWASLGLSGFIVDLWSYLLGHPKVSGRIGVWLGTKMKDYMGLYGLWALVAAFTLGLLFVLRGDRLIIRVARGAVRTWSLLWGRSEEVDLERGEDVEETVEAPVTFQPREGNGETVSHPRSKRKELPTLEVVLSKKVGNGVETDSAATETGVEHRDLPLSSSPSWPRSPEIKIREAPPPSKKEHRGGGRVGKYRLPPLDLLDYPPPTREKADRAILEERAALLEEKLSNYGVAGKVVSIHYGPVVTMFEFQPSPGVKVSRIANLSDDIAMAMKALGVRIVAPIPGKDVVGIEIPNDHREPVYFREIIGSDRFKRSSSPLTMALGKDIFGKPFVADLKRMPHLLVAGATGSGKSMGLNTIICSILYKATPQKVKFIMVDPKMLEFSVYNGVPHLITPVITDPRKAASALGWAVTEMERRYALLTQWGVRNIEGYNRMAEDPLPSIVVVIDELADLMMVAAKDVETLIARLAQKARAAGIHLVVATQRPSVDVITGLIKANFPCRISFKVTSKVDSRTILDTMGAEKLLGLGDMLFLPPGTSDLVRLHGAYISDQEILRVATFWQEQEEPQFDEEIVSRPLVEGGVNGMSGDMDDELYHQAVDLVVRTGHASASMIQRYLKIGYNRAARLIERMEKEGVVGPAQGSKPREVLLTPRDLSEEE
ncbi:MAG TPA: hypothetical protein ENF32_05940 [Thermosulfidibacter takaii]|uniref:FtsK domain-containing protein n=1 Tax=Thermosulfidibacter takaii TaxID=412593 RepID=A0A7C0U6Z1_9BACT|nr:hypothetical protein [Thermosulfidibacter takaii]